MSETQTPPRPPGEDEDNNDCSLFLNFPVTFVLCCAVTRKRLVLDTESSLCHRRHQRLLVSLAYEVVDGLGRVHAAHYELVWQPRLGGWFSSKTEPTTSRPKDIKPDIRSVRIHGLNPEVSWRYGQPLLHVLQRLYACLEAHRPCAVVGHDVWGDVSLLVSESVHCGMPCHHLPQALRRLLCTRMMATHRCAIPLPPHLLPPQSRRHPPNRPRTTVDKKKVFAASGRRQWWCAGHEPPHPHSPSSSSLQPPSSSPRASSGRAWRSRTTCWCPVATT